MAGYNFNIVTVVLIILLSAFYCPTSSSRSKSDRLLLIAFDGFRWNYLDRTDTPNFDKITENGVQAVHGLKNAFITKTFPNHFTLVTGQWEESHGIVANYMFDPVLNKTFSPHNEEANTDSAWFDVGGEPIWVTNQLSDGKTCVIMWVGGGAPVKNILPTKFMKFNPDVSNKTKVDQMIKWFKEGNCNLGLMYFNQPDRFGHQFGPESEQVTRMIGGLDKLVGYLLDKLEDEKMTETTNIIITSDHGFTSTPEDKAINLAGVVDLSVFKLESSTPVAGIWPHPDYRDEIFANLTAAAKKNGHFTVYDKESIPDRFYYSHNRRIPPILAVADDHYSFTLGNKPTRGNHGYDNNLQDMHPFFVATGPAFKSNFTVDTFESVDVYPLMCNILGLKPAPNNGSLDVVRTLLLNNGTDTPDDDYNIFKYMQKRHVGSILVACIIIAAVAMAACIAIHEVRKKKKRQENLHVIMDNVTVALPKEEPPVSDTSNIPLLHDQDF